MNFIVILFIVKDGLDYLFTIINFFFNEYYFNLIELFISLTNK